MEARKVTIINNRTQSQKVIMSSASTLGELKRDMREAGVSYEGMTFFEGHMRAELKDNSAPLPETVKWKGEDVNELTFLLTAPEKKIKSGSERTDAYAKIKELGLQDACQKKYGKNFTMCKTSELLELIESNSANGKKAIAKPAAKKEEQVKETKAEAKKEVEADTTKDSSLRKSFDTLVSILYENGILDEIQYAQVKEILSGSSESSSSEKLSKAEIDEMFGFVR